MVPGIGYPHSANLPHCTIIIFSGTMENSHAQTLSLSNLEEGTYQFKLEVSGGTPPVVGEAYGNVTVQPGKCLTFSQFLYKL